ncbi:hypothetical protein DPMN_021947 [Dreissena polymorpha]|uniref:B box-type domain-containing protein n=1 Tax=Dreissena polymorpha TaxID=45954 RepID=A0A9D4SC55_DREPO|nr:hypothetical protein DPMN_021947 [Dreissena polymorpha]
MYNDNERGMDNDNERGMEVIAVVYCIDCDERFCDACGHCHKKLKISRDHKLCNLREAPPAHVVQLMKKLTTCPNHQSEEVVYICVDEDQLCCIQCANTTHRHCRQLETIEQCLRDGLVKNNLQRNNKTLSTLNVVETGSIQQDIHPKCVRTYKENKRRQGFCCLTK